MKVSDSETDENYSENEYPSEFDPSNDLKSHSEEENRQIQHCPDSMLVEHYVFPVLCLSLPRINLLCCS